MGEESRPRGITEDVQGYVLQVGEGDRERNVTTRFLIGVDRAVPVVRRVLFEQVKMNFQIAIRYYDRASLNLNPDYVHYFALLSLIFFEINSKVMLFWWILAQSQARLLRIGKRPKCC
jgi:hypothetical protein